MVTDIRKSLLHFYGPILDRGRQVLDGHGAQRRLRMAPAEIAR